MCAVALVGRLADVTQCNLRVQRPRAGAGNRLPGEANPRIGLR